jgi:hypothetical protein
MDIFSHGLWTGVIFKNDKKIWWPIFFSVAPDIFSNGIYMVLSVIKGVSFIDSSREHLNPIRPDIIPILYSVTHSLVFFALAFLIVWFILKKPWWALGAWGIHIAIDIPFHSTKFFATPFLYPLSSFSVNSINWGDKSYILIINFCLLAIIYLGFFIFKNKRKHFLTYFNEKRKLIKR